MTQTLRLMPRLLAGAALSLALALPASAQSAPPANAPAEPAVTMIDIYSDADAQATLDARLIALKTVIGLTPDQEKLWPPVDSAIRQAAKNANERAAARVKAEPAQDFLDVLERVADAEAARAADLKSVIAAAKPLVDALSAEQKRRIPAFLGMTDIPGKPQPTRELWIFEAEQE